MPDDRLPDYVRVVEYVRRKIRSGEYPPGSKLPTKLELVDLLGTKGKSIDTAMIALKAEGLIYGRQGRGVYVADPLPPTSPDRMNP
jgi:GntR family transcriptional regulator